MSECARAAVSLRWPTRFGKVPHRRLRVLCAVLRRWLAVHVIDIFNEVR